MKLDSLMELMAYLALKIQSPQLRKLRFSCSELSEAQKNDVHTPIELLTVLRKKSTSNEHFISMLERLFEGVPHFEQFSEIVSEFRRQNPYPNSILPPPQPSLPNGVFEFKPGNDQKRCYKKALLNISSSLEKSDLGIMVALSPIPDSLKEHKKEGFQLFEELQRRGCISENDTELIAHFFTVLNLKKPLELLHDYLQRFPPVIHPSPPPSAPLLSNQFHSLPDPPVGAATSMSSRDTYSLPPIQLATMPSIYPRPSLPTNLPPRSFDRIYPMPGQSNHTTLSIPVPSRPVQESNPVPSNSYPTRPRLVASSRKRSPDPGNTPPASKRHHSAAIVAQATLSYPQGQSEVQPSNISHRSIFLPVLTQATPSSQQQPSTFAYSHASSYGRSFEGDRYLLNCAEQPSYYRQPPSGDLESLSSTASIGARSEDFCQLPISRENTDRHSLKICHGMEPPVPQLQAATPPTQSSRLPPHTVSHPPPINTTPPPTNPGWSTPRQASQEESPSKLVSGENISRPHPIATPYSTGASVSLPPHTVSHLLPANATPPPTNPAMLSHPLPTDTTPPPINPGWSASQQASPEESPAKLVGHRNISRPHPTPNSEQRTVYRRYDLRPWQTGDAPFSSINDDIHQQARQPVAPVVDYQVRPMGSSSDENQPHFVFGEARGGPSSMNMPETGFPSQSTVTYGSSLASAGTNTLLSRSSDEGASLGSVRPQEVAKRRVSEEESETSDSEDDPPEEKKSWSAKFWGFPRKVASGVLSSLGLTNKDGSGGVTEGTDEDGDPGDGDPGDGDPGDGDPGDDDPGDDDSSYDSCDEPQN